MASSPRGAPTHSIRIQSKRTNQTKDIFHGKEQWSWFLWDWIYVSVIRRVSGRPSACKRDAERERERALKAQWILKSSWSVSNYENGFWSKPLMAVIWDRPTMILSLYVHWNVCTLHIVQAYTWDFSSQPKSLVRWYLTHFRLDYHHLNGPFELWLFLAKRVSRTIWIYIHNSECGSSIADRSICSRPFEPKKNDQF